MHLAGQGAPRRPRTEGLAGGFPIPVGGAFEVGDHDIFGGAHGVGRRGGTKQDRSKQVFHK